MDIDHILKFLVGYLLCGFLQMATRVVDKNAERSLGFLDIRDQPLTGFKVGHVVDAPGYGRPQCGCRLTQFLFPPSADHHAGTASSQGTCHSQAQTGASAGNQRRLAGKIKGLAPVHHLTKSHNV